MIVNRSHNCASLGHSLYNQTSDHCLVSGCYSINRPLVVLCGVCSAVRC